MDLTDKVALITGARRVGAAVAVVLATRGAMIGLSYRRAAASVAEAETLVRRVGRRVITLQADLTRPDDCRRLVEQTVASLGRLDVLVNMASSYVSTPLDDLDESHWERALAVDAKGAYLCALAAVPHLRASGGGRIINVSDWVARSGRPRYPGYLPYYVAKSAVIALTEALAFELAGDGILVNAVAPGPIRPPEGTDADEVEAVSRATPLGRWGGDHALAQAVVALVESDFVTGETIRVDGGRHLK